MGPSCWWSVCYRTSPPIPVRLRVHCRSDKEIRGGDECVRRYRSSRWSCIDPPRRSVMAPVLLDLPPSVLWVTNPPAFAPYDGTFELSTSKSHSLPHLITFSERKGLWKLKYRRSPAPVADLRGRLTFFWHRIYSTQPHRDSGVCRESSDRATFVPFLGGFASW